MNDEDSDFLFPLVKFCMYICVSVCVYLYVYVYIYMQRLTAIPERCSVENLLSVRCIYLDSAEWYFILP